MMADADERSFIDESAAPEPVAAQKKSGSGRKKKKSGCGFFLFLILLAVGVACGLHVSGGVDLRPYVYYVVPRIPYAGETLKDLLSIPDVYAMTADERRRAELDEWENRIAVAVRSMDERERYLDAMSDDLGALESTLEAEREELAARIKALSEDIVTRDAGPSASVQTSANIRDIEETIRTFQDMSPRNAASILEKLDDNLAVAILDGLPQDIRGTLLGRMDANIAARLTEQLTELQRRRSRQRSN